MPTPPMISPNKKCIFGGVWPKSFPFSIKNPKFSHFPHFPPFSRVFHNLQISVLATFP